MAQAITAERGQWYKRLDLDENFEVVAIDRDEECIEIQYYSGEIEEIDEISPSPSTTEDTEEVEDTKEKTDQMKTQDNQDETWF